MNKEHQLQSTCVRWFRLQYPNYKRLLFAIPNGAYLQGSPLQRAKRWKYMEAEGAQSGVVDLFLAVPNKDYHGLFIEMKVKPNTVSNDQLEFMHIVSAQGYATIVCYSFEKFVHVIEMYLQ